jgi:anion-transporting  ArsA/GET3 family ATPase
VPHRRDPSPPPAEAFRVASEALVPGSVLDKRLVFVTGKGGVGRTTVAAALGLAAARRGKRAIVCEVAQQERVSQALGRAGVGFVETELAPGLWAISIDPQQAMEEYLRERLGSRRLYELLFRNRLFQYLVAATPGLRELLTMGKIWELAQLERRTPEAAPYDLVIVDAPATGHGLAILRTPRTFRDVARVGPIRRQADIIHSFVSGRKAGVVCVARAEEMPVNEALDLRRRLVEELDMELDALVVNALYPERFSRAEADLIAADGGSPPARAARGAALAEHRRARAHRAQLRRLRRGAEGRPLVRLPFLFVPTIGAAEWERLADELGRRL